MKCCSRHLLHYVEEHTHAGRAAHMMSASARIEAYNFMQGKRLGGIDRTGLEQRLSIHAHPYAISNSLLYPSHRGFGLAHDCAERIPLKGSG